MVTIVLVDPFERSRLSVSRVLSELGDVEAFPDARSAWGRLLSGGVDVVVTELVLEGMDGLEFIRQVRSTGPTSAIPVVALTGDWRPASRQEALAAGAARFLVKPATPMVLRVAVLEALGRDSEANSAIAGA